MVSSWGQGLLSAANPTSSSTPPMQFSEWCELPLMFHLAQSNTVVRNVLVRVVEDLSHELIVGATFLKTNRTIVRFLRPSRDLNRCLSHHAFN